ncbi:MAG: YdcF family protein [Rhodospirillales bacterium]|jgi:uncharacterized SAM-binding protein YcdF (DUF218 family)
MDWTDVNWIKPLLLPPGAMLIVILAALLHGGRSGRAVALVATLALAVIAMPAFDRTLNAALERAIPEAERGLVPGAIVVLSADYRDHAPEYGEAAVGPATLARLRHAAFLHRQTGLPILVSGGGTPPERRPDMGEAMRLTLARDFSAPPRWVEGRSRNTYENAVESARILRAAGIEGVILVTHASHMPRSARVFAAAGLRVAPAPAGGIGAAPVPVARDFLPNASALFRSTEALHEILGLVWYEGVIRLRGGAAR